jgi:hypothetical protein
MQFKIKLQNTGSVGLHMYREWTIPDCPKKFFYTNPGEKEIWAVLGRDGQLMSEQETLLYLEVMIMMMSHKGVNFYIKLYVNVFRGSSNN